VCLHRSAQHTWPQLCLLSFVFLSLPSPPVRSGGREREKAPSTSLSFFFQFPLNDNKFSREGVVRGKRPTGRGDKSEMCLKVSSSRASGEGLWSCGSPHSTGTAQEKCQLRGQENKVSGTERLTVKDHQTSATQPIFLSYIHFTQGSCH
jgi:hypothetical protein